MAELVPSDRIRVRKSGPFGRKAEGDILAIDKDMILIFDPPDTVKVDLTRRYNIQYYAGSKSKMGQGALVGGIVGGVLGLVFGLILQDELDGSEEVVAIILVGTGGGALVGALIGDGIREPVWEDLHFAPPPKETRIGLNIRF